MTALARPGGVARLKGDDEDTTIILGTTKADELATATATRSPTVDQRVVRTAARLVAEHRTTAPGAGRPCDRMNLPGRLDAWIAQACVEWTTSTTYAGGPGAIRNDIGAICAAIDRVMATHGWPKTKGARESTGIDKDRTPRGSRVEIPPWNTLEWIDEIATKHKLIPTEPDEVHRDAAALVFGALNGMPVGAVRHMQPGDVQILDYVTSRKIRRKDEAFTVEIPPTTPLKVRPHIARGSKAQHPAKWTAGADPAVRSTVLPWLRVARERGWKYLFPSDLTATRGDTPVSARALNARLKEILPELHGRTWHGCRYGNSRALDAMTPRPDEKVKNTIQLRKNSSMVGSRETYTKDDIDPILRASRRLRATRWEVMGAFMRSAPDSDGPSDTDDDSTDLSSDTTDEDSSTTTEERTESPPPRRPTRPKKRGKREQTYDSTPCTRCNRHIGGKDCDTWLCDEAGCTWSVCTRCEPVDPGALRCPEHTTIAPPAAKKTKKK